VIRSILAGFVSALVLTGPILAAPKNAPGATVGELIALARQLSPELAAAALTADAAIARITSAGALPDPNLQVWGDNLDQRNVSMNGITTIYRLMQEFPLWGKLDLKRDIAGFEATAAQYRRRGAEFELIARVKSVFAARYATFQARALTQRTLDTVLTAAQTLRDRYAQGGTTQEDVIRLEIEAEELSIEIERLRGQQTKTAAQLNALLNRRPDASLAVPAALRRLPNEGKMNVAVLVDRAIRLNPTIAEGEAKAKSATAAQSLAERNRYPDVSLGVMHTRDKHDSYAGTGVMGEVRIPLQWEAKEAEIAAASAERAAAEQRVNALRAGIGGELAGMLAEYRATAKTLQIMQQHHLPKSEMVVRSALSALESGQGDVLRVLDAIRRLRNMQLEILKIQVQQQALLAEIEKAIGGDL
jgi:outer membrane protein, heavy metal efflux system